MFGPSCEDLRYGVIAEGVARDAHSVLADLLHDQLLLLRLLGALNNNFHDTKAIFVQAELGDL